MICAIELDQALAVFVTDIAEKYEETLPKRWLAQHRGCTVWGSDRMKQSVAIETLLAMVGSSMNYPARGLD